MRPSARPGGQGAGLAVVVVGHVTKDGALAGPRALEHVVDTVLGFEGDRHHALRLLRATKHRFGPTGELGVFELGDAGLVGVPDAGALLLADRRPGVAGSVVVPAMEGSRPLLVEVQALVSRRRASPNPDGRRRASTTGGSPSSSPSSSSAPASCFEARTCSPSPPAACG